MEQHSGQDAGMDRRLAEAAVVLRLPAGLVEPAEDVIEQPDGMIRWRGLVEPFGKENDLLAFLRCARTALLSAPCAGTLAPEPPRYNHWTTKSTGRQAGGYLPSPLPGESLNLSRVGVPGSESFANPSKHSKITKNRRVVLLMIFWIHEPLQVMSRTPPNSQFSIGGAAPQFVRYTEKIERAGHIRPLEIDMELPPPPECGPNIAPT